MAHFFTWPRLCAWVFALSLAACGGDQEPTSAAGLTSAQAMARDAGRLAEVVALDPALFSRPMAATFGRTERLPTARPRAAGDLAVSASNQALFALGESAYSQYFPSAQPDRLIGDFVYRYYPQTGAYLLIDAASRIYVFGGPFGPDIVFVGLVSDYLSPPQPVCTNVLTGFDVSRLDAIPDTSTGDGPGSDGPGSGAGVGGNEGAIVGADVSLWDSTGRLLGRAVSDQNGYVRMKACGAIGPFKIEFAGNATAQYFDEGIALRDGPQAVPWVPFPTGASLTAVVENLTDHHIAVTPLTHIAAQSVPFESSGALGGARAVALGGGRSRAAAGPVSVADVRAANERVRTIFNQQFAGTGIQLDGVTRATALANSLESLRNFSNDSRGRYGQILTALAKSAAQFNPALPNPAREMSKQLTRDLSDGVIDGKDSAGAPVSATPETKAYDFAQLPAAVVAQAAGRLEADVVGQGSIVVTASSAAKVICSNKPGDCYPFGTVVTVQAQAAPGYSFQGWGQACVTAASAASCQLTLSGDKLVRATFSPSSTATATVRLSLAAGVGSIAATPAGESCGDGCLTFPLGSRVVLTAVPGAGYAFNQWGGNCAGSSTCTLNLTGNRTASASFVTGKELRVSLTGTGAGSVVSEPAGIDCGAQCVRSYLTGTAVQLTASAARGSTFIGWSGGGCSGTGPCTVVLTSAVDVQAAFASPATLTVLRAGDGSGTVSASDGSIGCGSVCSRTYPGGTQVTLSASASAGSAFSGWSGGGCSGTGSCVVRLDQSTSVVASFAPIEAFTLAVNVVGGGSISTFPAGINACTSACSTTYLSGTAVTLVPTAQAGTVFVGWSDSACPGTDACPIVLTGNRSVTATFAVPQYLVLVTINGLSSLSPGLQLTNGSSIQTLPGGATSASFGPYAAGASYNVRITQQPLGQKCTMSNGSGVIGAANVTTPRVDCSAVNLQWSWEGGSQLFDQPAVHGAKGVASASTIPGARDSMAVWNRSPGQVWVFGGAGIDSNGSYGFLADLWQFNPSARRWSWIEGPRTSSALGVYDSLGGASALNMPGARVEASTWVDASGRLWMHGGRGYGASGYVGSLDDLWRFDPVTRLWTWVDGGPVACVTLPGACPRPQARAGSVTWRSGGDLWLFGGYREATQHYYNDLWRYDMLADLWTQVRGDSGEAGYGSLGVASSGNTPGARAYASAWSDAEGYFWVFGGTGGDASTLFGTLSDLWRYRPSDDTWAWMGGPTVRNSPDQFAGGSVVWPGSRDGASAARGADGRFWLFGGYGVRSSSSGTLSDLWVYDPIGLQFTRVSGTEVLNVPAAYGSLGVPSPLATPGGRRSAAMAFDSSDQLWLYGGWATPGGGEGFTGRRSDQWRLGSGSAAALRQPATRPR